jgi:DMSO/TMAO reductase YedYZ molybdopterin-dependent catalytic subunit
MLAMSALMLAGRFTLDVPTLPEVFSDTVLFLIPAPIFSAVLDTLSFAGKPLLLFGLFVSQLGVGALVGWYVGVTTPLGLRAVAKRSLLVCAVLWLATVTLLMPVLGVGFLGILTSAGPGATSIVYLVSYATYGLAVAWLYTAQIEAGKPIATFGAGGRRRALGRLSRGVAGLLGIGMSLGALEALATASGATRRPARLPSPITPVRGFYVVSKDLLGVKVDLATWRLVVAGHGAGAKTFDLEDLQAMPRTKIVSTLTCISNEIGGDLLGTARWTGVRLRDLLNLVGVGPRAYAVVVSAWDNYADSIPIARALDPNTLLAYAMDDAPLQDIHGFPLRLVVPGLYGIKNVKWIQRIEVIDHGFVGYWQARGWTDDATVQTQSQIDVPFDHSVFPIGPIQVGGIAFAGRRGISRVELSVDGEKSWISTTLHSPMSPLTWTTWTTVWRPSSPGWYRLTVRATDGLGDVQRADVTPPIPDGATGYHAIQLRVG